MSARLENDPDKYIRVVKGGRYQARPFCPIEHERYELGELFETRHAARAAILEFWRGKRPDIPKYTRKISIKGVDQYMAIVPHCGETFVEGPFETREIAGIAARMLIVGLAGRLFSAALLKRK